MRKVNWDWVVVVVWHGEPVQYKYSCLFTAVVGLMWMYMKMRRKFGVMDFSLIHVKH